MLFRQLCRSTVFALSGLLAWCAGTAPMARADAYRIVTLDSDAARFLYGIDDNGTVVLDKSSYCVTTCYATYVEGVYAGTTTAAPALVWDNGSPCSPSFAGYVVQYAVCNDGRVAWTGYAAGNPNQTSVFSGSDRLAFGGGGPLLLNAQGDVVFDDEFSQEIYVAFSPATTPEPASFSLLVSGVLAAAGETWRRHRKAARG